MISDYSIIEHIITYYIILGTGNWQFIDLTGSSNESNQRQDGVAVYPSQTRTAHRSSLMCHTDQIAASYNLAGCTSLAR